MSPEGSHHERHAELITLKCHCGSGDSWVITTDAWCAVMDDRTPVIAAGPVEGGKGLSQASCMTADPTNGQQQEEKWEDALQEVRAGQGGQRGQTVLDHHDLRPLSGLVSDCR